MVELVLTTITPHGIPMERGFSARVTPEEAARRESLAAEHVGDVGPVITDEQLQRLRDRESAA